ncbi:hypothetical protein AVEN_209356-1 [Araneus ventricosus]|uniref:Uncharacterized protein n=1 Tax=Araneus ventricosus TaxID=182803 RepID=A0A4Y2B5T9_ARAVE|nr:hypothetical protein AVEN_209356-1 [Araneus ventricosus]
MDLWETIQNTGSCRGPLPNLVLSLCLDLIVRVSETLSVVTFMASSSGRSQGLSSSEKASGLSPLRWERLPSSTSFTKSRARRVVCCLGIVY